MRQEFPAFDDLRYYRLLAQRRWNVQQTMKAHLQDLARSIGCRGLREIQLTKLRDAVMDGEVHATDAADLEEAILDEFPVGDKPSHFDVRLQLFSELGYSAQELETVRPLAPTRDATARFRTIFDDRSLLEISAAVGAIELWYVPVARRLEELYLELGYSQYQVATYTLHGHADIYHSATALGFVEHHARQEDLPALLSTVRAAFASVRRYDDGRYEAAADDSVTFEAYLSCGRSHQQ